MSVRTKQVTGLLARVAEGDRDAFDELVPVVYDELHARAAACMARERADHTLQPTALVHEAYLRLVDQNRAVWTDRTHFFAIAARSMRRVLVEHARAHNAAKRRGRWCRIALDEGLLAGRTEIDPVEIEEALSKLQEYDERLARIVEMRFFGGLTIDEVAAALELSPRTVKDDWRVARTLLFDALGRGGSES